jgi:hypothetical protein
MREAGHNSSYTTRQTMFTFQQAIEELQRRYPGCGLGANLENEQYGQYMRHMTFREARHPDSPAVFVATEDSHCTIWYQEKSLPGQAGSNGGISCGRKPWQGGQPQV